MSEGQTDEPQFFRWPAPAPDGTPTPVRYVLVRVTLPPELAGMVVKRRRRKKSGDGARPDRPENKGDRPDPA